MRKLHLEDRIVEYQIYKSGVIQIRDDGKKTITSVNAVHRTLGTGGPYYCECGCGQARGGSIRPGLIKQFVELISV